MGLIVAEMTGEWKWQMTVRVVCVVIYILSWLAFSLGFIMYYTILVEIQRLQILNSAGVMILLPMISFVVPGLGIGVFLVFHIISRRPNRRHIYMALITFFSVPYLTGAGVTIFMASAFLGTINNGTTKADGVPTEWVSLVMFGCIVSVTVYWISIIFVSLSNVKRPLYRSHELLRTSEYQPLPP